VPRLDRPRSGALCWLDLAARDDAFAKAFHAQAFGWPFEDRSVNGGHSKRCRCGGQDVGSPYPLTRVQFERGPPSHWTPCLRVDSVDATAWRIAALGAAASWRRSTRRAPRASR
jgi:uncharacterized protein